MGASVSTQACQANFGIALNCSATPGESWGDYTRGQFPPDPDIAGIGIVSVFISVTSLALLMGYFAVAWQLYKSIVKKKGQIWEFYENGGSGGSGGSESGEKGQQRRRRRRGPSVSDILETIVVSCSDQQLFTGGAYALTVRYFKGCSVSAYHYDVLVNGLLITCATHLVAVTVVMNYWRYPVMAALRVAVTVLIFLVTGVLLTHRDGTTGAPPSSPSSGGAFPIAVPPFTADETAAGSPLFLPAACFESDAHGGGNVGLPAAVQQSIDHLKVLVGGPDQAWTLYVAMVLWWALAILAEAFRFLRRGLRKEGGARHRFVHRVRSWATGMQPDGRQKRERLARLFRRVFHVCFAGYLVAGLGLGTAVVVLSALYIQSLRAWVNGSGWLELDATGRNPENDATSFGQLVPILMSALTVFAFMQMLSEKLAEARRESRETREEESARQDSVMASMYEPYRDEKKQQTGITVREAPESPAPVVGSSSQFELRLSANDNGADSEVPPPVPLKSVKSASSRGGGQV